MPWLCLPPPRQDTLPAFRIGCLFCARRNPRPGARWRERPARFGYEAIRVPLFLYWAGHLAHPQLAAFTRHAAAPAFPAWVALDSEEISAERAPAGFEAIARLARGLPAITRAQLPWLNGSYYSSSLTLLAALANDDLLDEERRLRDAGNGGRSVFGSGARAEKVGRVP